MKTYPLELVQVVSRKQLLFSHHIVEHCLYLVYAYLNYFSL